MLPREIDCGPCLLRPWRRSDREALLLHADDRRVWRNLRDRFPHPYTGADADEWLAHAADEPVPAGTWAVEVEGRAAGTVSLHRGRDDERCAAEIGYWLGEPFWGRGIATAAVRGATEAALAEPELFRVFAAVFAWNPASMRVLEKAGYLREGVMVRGTFKDGVLVDRVLYARTRDPGLPYVPAAP